MGCGHHHAAAQPAGPNRRFAPGRGHQEDAPEFPERSTRDPGPGRGRLLPPGDGAAEKPLAFPFSLLYRQRLRLGIPALFRFFNEKGYDVWVYSANYYSFKHIQRLFMLYRTRVTGIVTGTARKGRSNAAARERLKKSATEHYSTTIHIDGNGMLRVDSRTGDYEEYPFNASGAQWTAQIMDLIGALDRNA